MEFKDIIEKQRFLKIRLAFQGLIVGIVASFFIVLFRVLIKNINNFVFPLFDHIKWFNIYFFIGIIICIVLGLLSALLLKYEPMISGSGIPQVQGELGGELSIKWYKVLWAKIVSGLISLGSGLTLGREGPSVQIGAASGKMCASILKRPINEHKYLISSGAASGLAAAFNAPMAGIVFALEEAHHSFSSLALIPAMVAALVSDYIAKEVLGIEPVLDFSKVTAFKLEMYYILIPLGILLALSGYLFNYFLVKSKKFYKNLNTPLFVKTTIPFIVTFLLIIEFKFLFGSGHELIQAPNHIETLFYPLLLLFIAKLFLLCLAFGSGMSGGIFFPLLVLGALVGQIFSIVLLKLGIITHQYINFIIILSMAAHFSAIVRAPVTGVLLLSEMTGSFEYFLPIALVSVISYIASELLKNEPIYESLLHMLLEKNEASNNFELDDKKILVEFMVVYNSKLDGILVKEANLPKEALLVDIKRGNDEIVPKGNTKIKGGDTLLFLVNSKNYAKIEKEINFLTKLEDI